MGESDRRVVLLTGAAGTIGAGFREEYWARYREHYALRLGVRDPAFRDDRFADVTVFDTKDLEATTRAMRGVDTVIHLAANADWQADFCSGLVEPNIVGAYHLFEAAKTAGCRRVVFASSVHAVMGYPVDHQAHEHDPPRPDTLYGATKVFGEALCASYAYCHGLSCLAVRIGAYMPADKADQLRQADNPQQLDITVTQRDLAQLFHRCILAPDDLRYAILHGLSDNRFKRLALEETRQLVGYAPQDDAFALSEKVGFGEERKV